MSFIRRSPHWYVCAHLCPDIDIDEDFGESADGTRRVDPQVRLEAEVKCEAAYHMWKAQWEEKTRLSVIECAEAERQAVATRKLDDQIEKRRLRVTGERELTQHERAYQTDEEWLQLCDRREAFRGSEELRIADKKKRGIKYDPKCDSDEDEETNQKDKKRQIQDEPEADSDEDDELRKINEDAPASRTRFKKKQKRTPD